MSEPPVSAPRSGASKPGRHPAWELLDKLQMDLRAMDRKLTELRAQVAALPLEMKANMRPACPHCGLLSAHLSDCPGIAWCACPDGTPSRTIGFNAYCNVCDKPVEPRATVSAPHPKEAA